MEIAKTIAVIIGVILLCAWYVIQIYCGWKMLTHPVRSLKKWWIFFSLRKWQILNVIWGDEIYEVEIESHFSVFPKVSEQRIFILRLLDGLYRYKQYEKKSAGGKLPVGDYVCKTS